MGWHSRRAPPEVLRALSCLERVPGLEEWVPGIGFRARLAVCRVCRVCRACGSCRFFLLLRERGVRNRDGRDVRVLPVFQADQARVEQEQAANQGRAWVREAHREASQGARPVARWVARWVAPMEAGQAQEEFQVPGRVSRGSGAFFRLDPEWWVACRGIAPSLGRREQ